MLTHFRSDNVDGYPTVAVDRIPDGRLEQIGRSSPALGRQWELDGGQSPPGVSQHDPRLDCRDQKTAPREGETFPTRRARAAAEVKHGNLPVRVIRRA